MLRTKLLNPLLLTALCTAFCGFASADIMATLPEYNGPFYDFSATYPLPAANIGNFTFSIPSYETVLGATISGTFGNDDVSPSTAPSDFFVDGELIEVAACDDPSADCAQGASPTAWSYTFTSGDLATLAAAFAGGSLDFNVIQNFPFVVQTGVTTLDIQVSPEPSSFVLLGGIALGVAVLLQRRRNPTTH